MAKKKPQSRSELRKRNAAILKRLQEFTREAESRGKSPAAQRAFRREWRRHVGSSLLIMNKAYDDGHDSAFWDAILFCEQTSTSKPPWLHEAIEKYAKDRINIKPLRKRREGRPSNTLRDLSIAHSVDTWRKEQILFGKEKKLRRVSYPWCFEMVRREFASKGTNLSLRTIEIAYRKGKKLRKTRDYYVSPFLEK